MGAYVPRKGDFVAVTFNPQSGREQHGRRPALIVSNDAANKYLNRLQVILRRFDHGPIGTRKPHAILS